MRIVFERAAFLELSKEQRTMEVERRRLIGGADTYEGEMTYRGRTFKVEASLVDRRGREFWDVEVLERTGRWSVMPRAYGAHPTLEEALDAAEAGVRALMDKNTDTPD